VIGRLRGKLSRIEGVSLFLVSAQDLRIGGLRSSSQYQFTLTADSLRNLREWEPKVRFAMRDLPQLVDVSTDQEDRASQTRLVYDRDTLARLGITPGGVNQVLNDAFGQRQISTLYEPLNQYKVVLEVDPAHAQDVSALDACALHTPDGALVPLASFSRVEQGTMPLSIAHLDGQVSTTISFGTAEGVTLAQGHGSHPFAMLDIGVPASVNAGFQGSARAFQQSLSNQPLLILGAIIAVYLVLGILYESLIHPLTILSTLPSAGIGAILALMAFNIEFGLIAIIGVLLLIGIVKKNAIMMIDFALDAERTARLVAACRDPRGLPAAPAAHPDDHAGGHGRRAAAGHRLRRGLGTAPAAGHRRGGRSRGEPVADAVHDAGHLSLSRTLQSLLRADFRRQQTHGDAMNRMLPLLLPLVLALFATGCTTIGPRSRTSGLRHAGRLSRRRRLEAGRARRSPAARRMVADLRRSGAR
jgi:hypothetical protein